MSKPASLEEHKKRRLKKKKTITKTTVKKGNFAIHDEDEVSWKNAASESDNDDDSKISHKQALYIITLYVFNTWRLTTFANLAVPVVELSKAPLYKSNSSSWATIREREPEPSREAVLQRNVVPEWDDVENEDERPSIAGVGKDKQQIDSK